MVGNQIVQIKYIVISFKTFPDLFSEEHLPIIFFTLFGMQEGFCSIFLYIIFANANHIPYLPMPGVLSHFHGFFISNRSATNERQMFCMWMVGCDCGKDYDISHMFVRACVHIFMQTCRYNYELFVKEYSIYWCLSHAQSNV